jgi:TnsA endonuclease N terminal
VRRVAAIGGNLRSTITSKTNETIQCESFQERKLTLLFDRDPTICAYRSQPERFPFVDSQGNARSYVPDFLVWRTSGAVEVHEVTLSSRRDQPRYREREAAARRICQERGWRYIVHTEESLPQATEEANLLALHRYRPSAYGHPAVTQAAQERLHKHGPLAFQQLSSDITQQLGLPTPTVVSALCHLLWHGILVTDVRHQLIFHDATPRADLLVWFPTGGSTS